jgi:hypothetical protein
MKNENIKMWVGMSPGHHAQKEQRLEKQSGKEPTGYQNART